MTLVERANAGENLTARELMNLYADSRLVDFRAMEAPIVFGQSEIEVKVLTMKLASGAAIRRF